MPWVPDSVHQTRPTVEIRGQVDSGTCLWDQQPQVTTYFPALLRLHRSGALVGNAHLCSDGFLRRSRTWPLPPLALSTLTATRSAAMTGRPLQPQGLSSAQKP